MNERTAGAYVSIVIPCYNRQDLIGSTIDSALANGEGAEVIVIDDGSTDASWQRINSYGNTISSYRISNSGVSTARNLGINKATRKYIKFLDSDDLLPPDGLKSLYNASCALRPGEVAFGDAVSVDRFGSIISYDSYGYSAISPPGPISLSELLSATMSPLLPLFPAELLRQIGGFNPFYSLGEDQELAVRMMIEGTIFVRVASIVAHIREHDGDRLSRSDHAALYNRHVILYNRLVSLLRTELHSNATARSSLSKQILCSARDAARSQVRPAAEQLFKLVKQWPDVDPTPSYLRLPYKIFGPYMTEIYLDIIKGLRNILIK